METNSRSAIRFTVLGGGLAGLSAGYYLERSGRSFQIVEKETRLGGNCVTFHEQDLAFDSGAHRFHDKDTEITVDLKSLLGDNLVKVDTRSGEYVSRAKE